MIIYSGRFSPGSFSGCPACAGIPERRSASPRIGTQTDWAAEVAGKENSVAEVAGSSSGSVVAISSG